MTQPKKVVLFDGRDLSGWETLTGGPVDWKADGEAMLVGSGNIVSKEKYSDAMLHVEFKTPYMPEAKGQARGNSGVFVQGCYEIQVLDSYGLDIPGKGDCGAIYNMFAPLSNACKPPEEWQSYDIIFRAARFNEAGEVVEKARMTVLQNGEVIQNNLILETTTPGGVTQDIVREGPLLLQDHGDRVCYRNIYLVHLPKQGSDTYEPRSFE